MWLAQILEKGQKDVYAAPMQLFRGINDAWNVLSEGMGVLHDGIINRDLNSN